MSLQTPTTIRTRQWKLIPQGEDTSRAGVSSLGTSIKRPTIVGLVVKPIGKPSAGNRHARFEERGWETGRWPKAPSYRAHPRLYQGRSLRRRSDCVRFRGDFCRCDKAGGMALHDPRCAKTLMRRVRRGNLVLLRSRTQGHGACPSSPIVV
jgi:hypothetical protein